MRTNPAQSAGAIIARLRPQMAAIKGAIALTIAPNEMARIDTTEGESLEFSCKSGATAMTVRMLTDVAAYKAK